MSIDMELQERCAGGPDWQHWSRPEPSDYIAPTAFEIVGFMTVTYVNAGPLQIAPYLEIES